MEREDGHSFAILVAIEDLQNGWRTVHTLLDADTPGKEVVVAVAYCDRSIAAGLVQVQRT